MALKPWIAAARLRTLPLAFSCILLGSFLAYYKADFEWSILIWSFLTTLFYQVLSNYANDYGDGVKGTDENRQGEKRAVASGEITASAMKKAVYLMAVVSWLSGAWLSYIGTQNLPESQSWVFYLFLVLNTGAVSSAIRYTVGGSAYGYKGFGDIYVLLFFGWIGVLGSFFLQAGYFDFWIVLPATSVGFLAMGVLNLNNMRDVEGDIESGKNTIPVRIGRAKAKVYHSFLLWGAMLFMMAYIFFQAQNATAWLSMLVLPLIFINWNKAMKAENPVDFDPLLKPLAIGTLLFALISGLAINLHTYLNL